MAEVWSGELRQALAASGFLERPSRKRSLNAAPGESAASAGLPEDEAPTDRLPALRFSQVAWRYDPVPRRDGRFQDPYNGGVNPEAFLYDPGFRPRDKTLMLFYKRLREIDVPEMMASILVESQDKPWEFQQAMTRQLWDEARHSLMGQVGFVALGVDWTQIPVNFTWSLNLNTQLTPGNGMRCCFSLSRG